MQDSMKFANEEMANNPSSRVPVVLCLDVSLSMSQNKKIQKLNKGLKMFYDAVWNDDSARYAADIAVISFNHESKVEEEFSAIDSKKKLNLKADGGTILSKPVETALDMAQKRKQEYAANGVEYFQPWLIIMSDGYPEHDNMQTLSNVQKRVKSMEGNRKLSVFPVAIGDQADIDVLAGFSKKNGALKLQGLKFDEFFEWLSQSLSKTSQSEPLANKGEGIMASKEKWQDKI